MEKEKIIGVFNNTSNLNNVLYELGNKGYTESDVSILAKKDVLDKVDIDADSSESLKEGAGEGAKQGGIAGGIIGLLAGIGFLTIPGIGALFITGPIAAALGLTGVAATTASGAATGALAGGLVGALVKWGADQSLAEELEDDINEGKIVLLVFTNDEEEDEIKSLLEDNNADKIKEL